MTMRQIILLCIVTIFLKSQIKMKISFREYDAQQLLDRDPEDALGVNPKFPPVGPLSEAPNDVNA